MVLAYMSVYFGMLLAPFVLQKRRELDALAGALAAVILLAGIAFVLLPAELGFAPVVQSLALTSTGTEGLLGRILLLADVANLDYNLIPSLHVALLVTCLGAYFVHAGTGMRLVFAAWIALVSASTILTHQHHLIDVVAGLALGFLGARLALGRAGHLLRSGDRRPTQ
jgi:membrane-associated phospholipid phosphatase